MNEQPKDGVPMRPDGVSMKGQGSSRAPTQLDRSQILDATAKVLRLRGYDGTTIRSIASELDCAVGSIYRYFKDKRKLLDAVCQRRFESVVQHAELGISVSRCVYLYARTAVEQPDVYGLMFWLHSLEQGGAQALPAVVEDILEQWQLQMELPGDARRLWAQMHALLIEGARPEEVMQSLGLASVSATSAESADKAVAK